ncbi:MAG: tRNA pseudouridine(38-40) synthase TruA [Rudaea sp.]
MHLLATVEYDGTDFVGFQRQKRGRTVQAELERALSEFQDRPVAVTGGGRTDAGVHAAGQSASFTIDWQRDLDTLRRAINAKLPSDIAVRTLRQVPDGFSARRKATGRVYEYRVRNSAERAPLQDRYALRVAGPLDVNAMQQAARLLVGWKDFGAFGTPPRGENTVRELRRADVRGDGELVLFCFEANAFLYRMVRRLVGTLLMVGLARIDLAEFRDVVNRNRRAGDSVPPQGLTLVEVMYDPADLVWVSKD